LSDAFDEDHGEEVEDGLILVVRSIERVKKRRNVQIMETGECVYEREETVEDDSPYLYRRWINIVESSQTQPLGTAG
jgi:hypothetical protein